MQHTETEYPLNEPNSQVDSKSGRIPFSVIIPVLNDAPALDHTLRSLIKSCRYQTEIIVVDGGSRDDTPQRIAEKYPDILFLSSAPGRGIQMNFGARHARGDVLLFLHADSILPPSWQDDVTDGLSKKKTALTVFTLQFNGQEASYRILEALVFLRNRLLLLPYGDQGFAMRTELFSTIGGYAEERLFEDVEFVKRAKKHGRIRFLAPKVITSARNWRQDGFYRRIWINTLSILQYKLGFSPDKIRRLYKGRKQAVLVFAKKPEPGKVKTRLAEGLGKAAAASLYADMVQRLIRSLHRRPRPFHTILAYSPADQYAFFLDWLGSRSSYIPQPDGDLGDRLRDAVHTCEAMGYTHMALIGTDCPDLEPLHIETAFVLLHNVDVVIGPAQDGGYYLIAFQAGCPADLFSGIDWSTEHVLSQTLTKIADANLRVRTLETLRDVDTVEDLRSRRP